MKKLHIIALLLVGSISAVKAENILYLLNQSGRTIEWQGVADGVEHDGDLKHGDSTTIGSNTVAPSSFSIQVGVKRIDALDAIKQAYRNFRQMMGADNARTLILQMGGKLQDVAGAPGAPSGGTERWQGQ